MIMCDVHDVITVVCVRAFVCICVNFVCASSMNGRAVLFIRYAAGRYEVTDEAKEFLSSVGAPFGVIAAAGKYRTGKSFLLNRGFLSLVQAPAAAQEPSKKKRRDEGGGSMRGEGGDDGRDTARGGEGRGGGGRGGEGGRGEGYEKTGFGVGSTTQACTKGIWIYTKTVTCKDTGLKCVIMDTEGTGAVGSGTDHTHDAKIFALALLLSSQFIYNSVGAIDEPAVAALGMVTQISQHVRAKSMDEDDCDIGSMFPKFIWVIRDFALEMTDINGAKLSSDGYLEHVLQPSSSGSSCENDDGRDETRRRILKCFRVRGCCTMRRPFADERDSKRLDDMEDSELRPEFLRDLINCRDRVLRETPSKTALGKPLTGKLFLLQAQALVDAFNTGAVPIMRDQCVMLAEKQAFELSDSCIQFMEFGIQKKQQQQQQHHQQAAKSVAEYQSFLKKLHGDAIAIFDRNTMADGDTALRLRGLIDEKLHNIATRALERFQTDLERDCRHEIELLRERISSSSSSLDVKQLIELCREAFENARMPHEWAFQVMPDLFKWLCIAAENNSFSRELQKQMETQIAEMQARVEAAEQEASSAKINADKQCLDLQLRMGAAERRAETAEAETAAALECATASRTAAAEAVPLRAQNAELLEALQMEKESRLRQEEDIRKSAQEFESRLDRIQSSSEETIVELRNAKERMEARIQVLSHDLQGCTAEKARIQDSFSTSTKKFEEQISQMRSQSERLETQLEETRQAQEKTLQRLRKEFQDELKTKSDQLSETMKERLAERMQTTDKLKALEVRIACADAENNDLRRQIADMEERARNKLRTMVEDEQLRIKLAECESEVRYLREMRDASRVTHRELTVRAEEAEQKLRETENRHSIEMAEAKAVHNREIILLERNKHH